MTRQEFKKILFRIAENNDKEAFKEFFACYHAKLLQFALLYVNSIQNAEDIVSEVMVRILKHREKVFKMENFEGYLFLSVKYQAFNVIKKDALRKNISLTDLDPMFETKDENPLELLLNGELKILIDYTIQHLPSRQKLVFLMVKEDGLKYKEVAKILSISDRTVEHHMDAAIKKIKINIEYYFERNKLPKPSITHIISLMLM